MKTKNASVGAIEITRKIWLEAPAPIALEKLKEDYSLLQSSDFQVEVALNPTIGFSGKLSTVHCQLSTEKRPQSFSI